MSALPILLAPPADFLHPAFDIRGNVVSFGFLADQAKRGPRPVRVVNVRGSLGLLDGSGTVGGMTLEYQKEKGPLADLDRQWGVERVRCLLESDRTPDGPELYAGLAAAWRRYVYFDHPGEYVIAGCWCVLSFVYLAFPVVPFLHVLGDKGSGKSQALDLLQELARDGQKADMSPASIGDITEARRATLLIDQVNSPDDLSSKMVSTLADSNRVGARRLVVLGGSDLGRAVREFATFGPKAFAGTEPLPDDLRDRAIVLRINLAPKVLPTLVDDPELAQLRADCYAWALWNGWAIRDLWDMLQHADEAPLIAEEWPDLSKYAGRPRDLWVPIECVMEALRVPEGDREAAREYYAQSQMVTTAEPPRDRFELVQALWKLARQREGDPFAVTRSEIEHELPCQDGDFELRWNAQKIGKQMNALVGVVKGKDRAPGRGDMVYRLGREALREWAKRYRLTE